MLKCNEVGADGTYVPSVHRRRVVFLAMQLNNVAHRAPHALANPVAALIMHASPLATRDKSITPAESPSRKFHRNCHDRATAY